MKQIDRDTLRTRPVAVTAIAHHVPPATLDNAFFEAHLDTTDAWIRARTGIQVRHVARGGGTSDLILPAARRCLERRNLAPEEVDCIVVATVTPDWVFPPTAAVVQRGLGAVNAWGFDLSAACSGFVFGLATAASLVAAGRCRRVLLCGADMMSTIVNYEDRKTAVLFGDAAGVVLLEPAENPALGLRDVVCRIDGSGIEELYMPAGGSRRPASAETVARHEHTLFQNGRTVFKAAVRGMAGMTQEILQRNGLGVDDVAWFVPHQANLRIITAVADEVGMPLDRVMINLDRYGNTTAATIPLCLSEWYESGRLRRGDRIVLASFGAGYTMGGIYLRWSLAPAAAAPPSGIDQAVGASR